MMVAEIFHQVSIWIVVLPLLVGIMNFNGLNRDSKWIFLLVALALVPQVLTALSPKTETPGIIISYNLFIPVEFALLFTIFFPKFRSAGGRLLLRLAACLFALLVLAAYLRLGLQPRFLAELLCLANVLYMVWILLLLKQEYSADETVIVLQNPFTWYLMATILYAPTTVASFALYYYIRDPANPVRLGLTIVNSTANILLYLFYSVGLTIRTTNNRKNILNIL